MAKVEGNAEAHQSYLMEFRLRSQPQTYLPFLCCQSP